MSFKWYGAAILTAIIKEQDQRLMECALNLKDRSVQQAPVDLGDLRGNCSVNKTGDGSVEIGYSLPYARVQHEHLEFKHPQGGKAKYLEDPFNANKEKYKRYIEGGAGK